MRVTVTGASGTIGLAAVRMLVRAGHEVCAFVRDAGEFRRRCVEERVEVTEGDVLERAAVGAALWGSGAAVHCVDLPPSRFARNWDAIRHTLEGLGPGGHLVYPSDLWVYGRGTGERIGPEHAKRSGSRLGSVRADLERAVLAEGGTVIHLPELYGPGVSSGRMFRAFRRALAGKTVWFAGDLDRPIEFLYLEDAARALVAAVGRRAARGAEYTASGHAETTPRRFLELVGRAVGAPARIRSFPEAVLRFAALFQRERRLVRDLSHLWVSAPLLDGTRMRRELGWMPEVAYREGIRRTVKWLRERERRSLDPSSAT